MEDPSVKALHNAGIYSHSQPMCKINDNEQTIQKKLQIAKSNQKKKIKLLKEIRTHILLQELSIQQLE